VNDLIMLLLSFHFKLSPNFKLHFFHKEVARG